jgi:ABC-type branched-subunit amino acid transport system ATPase component
MRTTANVLRADGVCVHFEGVKAVDEVHLVLHHGEILGLIGPNGAGKTTLVNAISGFQRPSAGQVLLDTTDITGLAPDRLAGMGLIRTFQAVRAFGELSVFENVEAATLSVVRRRSSAETLVWELLRWVGLADRADHLASSLPYGDERRLGLIRALAMQPTFLLLDEPAAGLNESESHELMHVIGRIRAEHGCGILVIEHDVPLIMQVCDRVQVLNYGRTISEGTPLQVQADRAVIEAYLGTGTDRSRRSRRAARS